MEKLHFICLSHIISLLDSTDIVNILKVLSNHPQYSLLLHDLIIKKSFNKIDLSSSSVFKFLLDNNLCDQVTTIYFDSRDRVHFYPYKNVNSLIIRGQIVLHEYYRDKITDLTHIVDFHVIWVDYLRHFNHLNQFKLHIKSDHCNLKFYDLKISHVNYFILEYDSKPGTHYEFISTLNFKRITTYHLYIHESDLLSIHYLIPPENTEIMYVIMKPLGDVLTILMVDNFVDYVDIDNENTIRYHLLFQQLDKTKTLFCGGKKCTIDRLKKKAVFNQHTLVVK